ncbi:MucR family transcriptional regulator [Asaia sp. As-1742]|uniref:MucR family transcriptional regulator n=1 Tax=Asaia sp. As-1742 TaxID=2608325 RepID=UPI001422FF6E|nr:MucR family transcriptional regulator [Asaia sp. As-1742]
MSTDKDIILGRLSATAQIVTAHLATTKVETDRLPELVHQLYASLSVEAPTVTNVAPVLRTTHPEVPKASERTEQSVSPKEAGVTTPTVRPKETKPEPAIPVEESVLPDYLVCLEDGKRLKSLKRHLMSAFGMTIEDYKAKWNLPDTYPTVAPNYAEMRRKVAQQIGLGKRSSRSEVTDKGATASSQPTEGEPSAPSRRARQGQKAGRPRKRADELRLANAFSR